MNKKNLVWALLISLLVPLFAFGQSTGDLGKPFVLPQVPIEELVIEKNEPAQIRGYFTIWNASEDLLGDLNYQISVINQAAKEEETGFLRSGNVIFDRTNFDEKISLSPNEKKKINFTYKIPNFISGKVTLRVRAYTSKNQGLGWADVDVDRPESGNKMIILEKGLVEFKDKKGTSTEGINIDPESKFLIKYRIINAADITDEMIPVLDIYEGLGNQKISSAKGKVVDLKANEKKDLEFEVDSEKTPGAYRGDLYLINNKDERNSNLGEYRWVVKGESAKILFARFYSLTEHLARIQLELVGPADRELTVNSFAEITLLDGNREIAKEKVNDLTLAGNVQKGWVEVPLSEKLNNPGIKIELRKTSDNSLLDTYELRVKGQTNEKEPPPGFTKRELLPQPTKSSNNLMNLVFGLLAFVVAVVVVILVFFKIKIKKGTFTIVSLLFLFFISQVSVQAHQIYAGATRVNFPRSVDEGWTELYVNQPVYSSSVLYDRFAGVPYSIDVHWPSCGNSFTETKYQVSNLNQGGTVSISNNTDISKYAWTTLQSKSDSRESQVKLCQQNGGRNCAQCPKLAPSDSRYASYGCVVPTNCTYAGMGYDSNVFDCDGNLSGKFNLLTSGSGLNVNSGTILTKIDTNYGGDWRYLAGYTFFNLLPSTPTVDLKVNGGNEAVSLDSGASANLSWSTSNVTSCAASAGWSGGKIIPTGNETISNILESKTFTLSCTGPAGAAQDSVTVNIKPTVTLNVSNNLVTPGGSTTLTWSSTNASSCIASSSENDWTGSKSTNNTSGETISGISTTGRTYTLTCSGPGGSANSSVAVNIGAPQILTFSADPLIVNLHGSSKLAWSTSDATSCIASSSGNDWTGEKIVNNTEGETIANITEMRTYTLTCSGPGGVNVSKTATIKVKPTADLTANPVQVDYDFTTNSWPSSVLTWSSTNATACNASGDWSGIKPSVNSVGESTGSFSTAGTATYKLQCAGPGGTSLIDTVTVVRKAKPVLPNIAVDLSASIQNAIIGNNVTLNWTTTNNPDSCVSSGDWSGSKNPIGGSEIVTINKTSNIYTIQCMRNLDGQTVTDSVVVNATSGSINPIFRES